ncbi:MAG TPA: hypothetical protein VJ691_08250 [Vicinamibacterales bacterium]|nr:hypothetical protein [Vicinamibacterales bacterium]
MSAYLPDQERAVRLLHRVRDWRESRLISDAQHDRMAADLETGLRRTNVFLRGTLFVLGVVIASAATGLLAAIFRPGQYTVWLLFAAAAIACYAGARVLVSSYRLYRFGIEEAGAVSAILFTGAAVAMLFEPFMNDNRAFALGFMSAAVAGFLVFFHFGLVYAAIIGMAAAALAPFPLLESDVASRSIAAVLMAAIFVGARLQRDQHGDEFPGDNYALIETGAWGGIYLVMNLRVSWWLAYPDEAGAFYWMTYAAIWMLPAAGLWIAIRERHRYLLDLNILLAIVTMMSNKPYLNAEQKPWDPIAFGILMIAIALGLRRWLGSGEGGARNGVVAFRLLASERQRLSLAGNVSVVQPSLHPQHGPEEPKPGFGGGRSGGAGASGKF